MWRKRSKLWFRTATKDLMRNDKAADRWLEKKIWPLYLAMKKKLTAERNQDKQRNTGSVPRAAAASKQAAH